MYHWQTVTSSQIDAIAYEGSILSVKFKGGTVYEYAKVPPEVFAALVTATSVGKAFGALIKAFPNDYPFTKLSNDTRDGARAPGVDQDSTPVGQK